MGNNKTKDFKKIKETYINFKKKNNVDWDYYIDLVYKSNYDIIISPFWIRKERLQKIDFTYPLFQKKQRIIYSVPENTQTNYKIFLFKLVQVWIKPFIIFIFFSIIIGILLNFHNYLDIKKNIYYSITGFFGQTSGLMFDIKKFDILSCLRIFVLIIILLFNLYISTTTISESIQMLKKSNKLEINIKGSKIAVRNNYQKKIIKREGGIPIIHNGNNFDFYIREKMDGEINGYLSGDITNDFELQQHKNIKISDKILTVEVCAFPINKKNKLFNTAINNEIAKISLNGELKITCNKYSNRSDNNSNTIC